ncbi:hypothetical protein PAXRUDRAFT_336682 [Paxillus rubicundulus Ve08.2h10]|uniref:Uncharacterized protein n=1 Tax=Paxillus rubicundulus Ve08.2h10 TaxID=930991 RepID=A0A0D0DS44_9AGAM|nr:hypothetical protein PAXRUDRAFT_336682 [Paxillus rubicundulus Ve08.2h10]
MTGEHHHRPTWQRYIQTNSDFLALRNHVSHLPRCKLCHRICGDDCGVEGPHPCLLKCRLDGLGCECTNMCCPIDHKKTNIASRHRRRQHLGLDRCG